MKAARERPGTPACPAWSAKYPSSVRAGAPRRPKVRLEVKQRSRPEHRAARARANTTAHAESELQALRAHVEQLSAQLRALQPQVAALKPRPKEGAARQGGRRSVKHDPDGGSVVAIAVERQTTRFGTALVLSRVVPLRVKARSDLPPLPLGHGGWLTQYVRMICTMVAYSVSMHSSTTDDSIGRWQCT
jgi:hypothetical protein